MSVRILFDDTGSRGIAALYCSTSEVAFGPLIHESDDGSHDAVDRAEAFLRFLPQDARRYSDAELLEQYGAWRAQEAGQWKAEEQAEAERSAAYWGDETGQARVWVVAILLAATLLTLTLLPKTVWGATARCFLTGEQVAGHNRLCWYSCLSGPAAITVRDIDLCPLSIDDGGGR